MQRRVQSLFGTRTADFLSKATTVAAILFLFTCIGLDVLEARRSRSLFDTQRPAVPVDVQQIQKVLEKIKAEETKKTEQASVTRESERSSPNSNG
jgi:preprotein translocase subunit SecG